MFCLVHSHRFLLNFKFLSVVFSCKYFGWLCQFCNKRTWLSSNAIVNFFHKKPWSCQICCHSFWHNSMRQEEKCWCFESDTRDKIIYFVTVIVKKNYYSSDSYNIPIKYIDWYTQKLLLLSHSTIIFQLFCQFQWICIHFVWVSVDCGRKIKVSNFKG